MRLVMGADELGCSRGYRFSDLFANLFAVVHKSFPNAVNQRDCIPVDVDRIQYDREQQQQSGAESPQYRDQPLRYFDSVSSAQSGAEDLPPALEEQPQRQRAEDHQNQRQPDRFTQQRRAEPHDAQRQNDQYDRNTQPEESESVGYQQACQYGS